MTAREKLAIEHPHRVGDQYVAGVFGCPQFHGYLDKPDYCNGSDCDADMCRRCWDREIPEEVPCGDPTGGLIVGDEKIEHPDTDIPEETITYKLEKLGPDDVIEESDKDVWELLGVEPPQQPLNGRCDLLPLDEVADLMTAPHHRTIFTWIAEFKDYGDPDILVNCLREFADSHVKFELASGFLAHVCTMLLDVSKYVEEDAKMWGDNSWQNGIPVNDYIDGAVRHYLKFLRGDKDEPHDTAFCWDIIRAIWTCRNKPELNPYKKEEKCDE